ncbi:PREDICTED: uncharacterized protein LOC106110678 [Papilio polytes]|uniref:uncharacterized protein LOC106110678 n=1 Tax=Papilio polytes TaxID=76194 RepID=UPI000675EF04|nr:PREDICTED: uncharacterized protein LOC106110678 [Papilio polytes]XP_013148040.1 PREDICTED: uncharacterized protein LOC106110678 [Papilio polytes]XP_013148047.1 PREDICTED: uncharacterized protein LOC106110678 [Papilio polytes]
MGSLVRWAVVAIVIYSVSLAVCEVELSHPSSPHPKDMYVVRATVYQVGIITNKTDHKTDKQQGHQESITFYNRNGSGIDLSGISNPLVTNVTAQSIVGLSPVDNVNQTRVLPWNALEKLASTQTTNTSDEQQPSKQLWRSRREVRELPATLVKGAAVLPPASGIQSLSLPPLIALNNNLSHIPVPIPNTSIVRYAKINTLLKTN